MVRRYLLGLAAAAVLTTPPTGIHAQQAAAPAAASSQFKRSIVLPATDLSAPGRQVVQGIAEVFPGGESGWHTHPGDEIFHVIQGTFILERAGTPPRTFQTGESFVVPNGTVHNAKSSGAPVAKILATYVIEAGKAPVIPAAAP